MKSTYGERFRQEVEHSTPLILPGAINAYCALLAKDAGFKAIYLSGASVANANYGKPDLGLTHLEDVVEQAQRIIQATELPLLVDADTLWDDTANTIKRFEEIGAAGIHTEDQVEAKRCGHRPGKKLIKKVEMENRIKAAVDAREDCSFVIMARTDAYSVEGLNAAIERAQAYVNAGADMIFAEALTQLDEFACFAQQVTVPVLANITEFGNTPLFSADELGKVGIKMVLFPLTAFRAMSAAALTTYKTLYSQGTQASFMPDLQSREELYRILNYYQYEKELDIKLSDIDK